MHGSDAEHLYLNIPVGAIVRNRDMDIVYNCETEGEDILILKGGRGGIGNEKFKSATNRAPEEFTRGQIGEYASFDVELRLIADIGIIGYPNAGKSSLLNALTRAGAKTADYAFTTLEPNLGAYHGVILADIPGLIEGASEGKGLGHKFLRHIKRVQSLVHMISSDSEDVVQSYKNIRKELEKFDGELLQKKEIIVLSKTDMLDQTDIDKKLKDLKSKLEKASGNKNIFTMSLFDDKSIKDFGTYITKEFGV
jgi:GTP-binding protein